MDNLKTVQALVKKTLEEDKQARNSDHILYLRVLNHVAEREGINLNEVSVPRFLMRTDEYKCFPIFETVRRTRQKLQAAYPELAACEEVQEARLENEAAYYKYAKSEV